MRENAGYKIVKGILLPNCEFVLGEKQTASGTKYVTWRCINFTDYYYGHYIESLDAATRDLYERAKEEIEFILLHTKETENENKT